MALYGLSIFNLHFWGFGVPYLLFGSWYLVRAYRLEQKLKLAKADARTVGFRWPGAAGPTEQALHPAGHGPGQAEAAEDRSLNTGTPR